MYLTRHLLADEPRWALDGRWLPATFGLASWLRMPRTQMADDLRAAGAGGPALAPSLPPIEAAHEVWAAGVTYLRSREARESESSVKDVYTRVYEAERPELFFKANGCRVVGHGGAIRLRDDSRWNVPEPELTLVINAHGDIVGYCAGNDVSSRDIEGENPLYLPQAKVYDGSCALGPGLVLCDGDALRDLEIRAEVVRETRVVFRGETRTSQMKRVLEDLVRYLCVELAFPDGVFLMTGTGIVPPTEFTLQHGDHVRVTVGSLTLDTVVGPRRRPTAS